MNYMRLVEYLVFMTVLMKKDLQLRWVHVEHLGLLHL